MASAENTYTWINDAECKGLTRIFFAPSIYERPQARLAREAKARTVCGSCAVRTECLTYALEHQEPNGIWGGLNEEERLIIQKRSQRYV